MLAGRTEVRYWERSQEHIDMYLQKQAAAGERDESVTSQKSEQYL